jgi:hypothetical protein
MATEKAHLELDATGISRLTIGGRDVTDAVRALRLEAERGQVTMLTIALQAEVDADAAGIIQAAPDSRAFLDQLDEFLAGLDPDQLERDALAGAEFDETAGRLFIAALRRYARPDQ